MARRKYDTEALVGQIRRERQVSIALSLAGVVILLFLFGLYFTMGDEDVPTVPVEHPALAGEDGSPSIAPAKVVAGSGSAATDDAPGDAAPATLIITLNRKAPVWVDGKRIGKFRKRTLALPPGSYSIRTRVGRRKLSQEVTVEGGEELNLFFDVRRKKATLTPVAAR